MLTLRASTKRLVASPRPSASPILLCSSGSPPVYASQLGRRARQSPCRQFQIGFTHVQSRQRSNRLSRANHRLSDLYAPAFLHQSPPPRLMATDSSSAANKAASIREVITPQLLEDVRETWFAQCDSEELIILPNQEAMMHWFRRSDDFDGICVSRFGPALEAIKTSGTGGEELLDAVQPSSPLEWLSLVLLLDQIPRNAYRGPQSAVVFTVFDPLARIASTRAVGAGVPLHAQVRYRIAYRMWFIMPLMHSEDLALHNLALEQIQTMVDDVRNAGEEPGSRDAGGDEPACRKILAQQKEEAVKRCEGQLEFEKKHQVIIERFGRYPHRNKALGRPPTPEEKEYLENGGDTFG